MQNEPLNNVYEQLLNRNLCGAIQTMEIFLSVHPHQINSDKLNAIKTDLQLMSDYWRQGFKDSQLPQLYDNLLVRMYRLYANIVINYRVRHSSYLSSLLLKVQLSACDWSSQFIREDLESFVSDIAMADLEPSHMREDKRKIIFTKHHAFMSNLFYHILTTDIWTDAFGKSMEDILLSPTIDSNDQQLIVSSVMLAAMTQFDMAKFRTLVHVYEKSTDEYVRQRAFVGWVFSLNAEIGKNLYPEEITLVEKLLENKQCCQELIELQRQLVYCVSTEKDNATIQSEIMPDLLKQQGWKMNRNGLLEQDDDTLNDILHPGEEESKLERIEDGFKRMLDMQKRGADIYFGGFSHMKRFPFFDKLINWFVPFYMDHPDIEMSFSKYKENKFLQLTVQGGLFCNSDKYSFLLAFDQVLNQMPQEIRDLLCKGEAGLQEIPFADTQQPAYIRRIYLQDLYRFFRISHQHDCFHNVFERGEIYYLFYANPIFSGTQLETSFNDMTAFMIKQGLLFEASAILDNYGEHRKDFNYYIMAGYLGKNQLESYKKAIELAPDNQRALAGYARSLFGTGAYQQALEVYEQLLTLQPERESYLLNKAVCLTNICRYDEAEKILYRLNYNYPDNDNVNRALAWTLACDGKYVQADKFYLQLLYGENPSQEDFLNSGYNMWFGGYIDEAAEFFQQFMKMSGKDPDFIIKNEIDLLRDKGITEPEMQMMLYIL